MTWKRTFVGAAILANLLVFVLPSMLLFHRAINPPAPTVPPTSLGPPSMFAGIGIILFAIGAINLACVYFAIILRGLNRKNAIAMGGVLCVLMALATLILIVGPMMVIDVRPTLIPPIIMGTVTFTTAGALLQVRPKPKPGWQCPKCDYDLRGLEDRTEGGKNGVCPECGLNKAERDAFAAE